MKSIYNDERAENPLEVGLYLLVVLMVMSLLMTVAGAFLDEVSVIFGALPLHTSWAVAEMATYMHYISWAYSIPVIFIIIVMIWGIRAVIRKSTYTTENGQQTKNTDDYEF